MFWSGRCFQLHELVLEDDDGVGAADGRLHQSAAILGIVRRYDLFSSWVFLELLPSGLGCSRCLCVVPEPAVVALAAPNTRVLRRQPLQLYIAVRRIPSRI